MPANSEPSSRTYFQSLRLRNFRKFSELVVDFDPFVNVIVAENGGGKSALLDALYLCISPFLGLLGTTTALQSLRSTDVRQIPDPDGKMTSVSPCSLEVKINLISRLAIWTLDGGPLGPGPGEVAKEIREDLQAYAERKRADSPTLPLIATFSPKKTALALASRAQAPNLDGQRLLSRLSVYGDALVSADSWQVFSAWFEAMSYEAQGESATSLESPHRPKQMLACIRKTVDQALAPSGWKSPAWDFVLRTIVASHDDAGRLPIELLSDGIQSVFSLVADLAHRAARLNPQFGEDAAIKTPGIVLIDEVDTHLHPKWQQRIVPILRATFPQIQFILTTHSDRVLTTVPAASIRVLDAGGNVYVPGTETQGHSASYVLADIFGVDPVPPDPNAERLASYRHLIEDGRGDSEDALSLRAQVEKHFGQGHPVLLNADRLKRLQAFKLRRNGGE